MDGGVHAVLVEAWGLVTEPGIVHSPFAKTTPATPAAATGENEGGVDK
jgi:hypothetical protein